VCEFSKKEKGNKLVHPRRSAAAENLLERKNGGMGESSTGEAHAGVVANKRAAHGRFDRVRKKPAGQGVAKSSWTDHIVIQTGKCNQPVIRGILDGLVKVGSGRRCGSNGDKNHTRNAEEFYGGSSKRVLW